MATYKPIQSIVLTASTSSVTFSGIDQSYTDLELVITGSANPSQNINLRYNGDTLSNYSGNYMIGDGSATGQGKFSNQSAGALTGAMYSGLGICKISIPNYSNTTTFKTAIGKSSTAGTLASIYCSLWRSTDAIYSITLNCTLDSGTTIDLYGIKSGAPQALGGDLVTTDGNYWYHTFRSTQAFTPLKTLSVDYLVVAGGGGGGGHNSGGGGAGGLRSTVTATGGGGSLESATSVFGGTSYTVTVGAGGAGGQDARGTAGVNSTFSSITSNGGAGGGGNNSGQPPLTGGGSGGGGTQGTAGSAGTTNQGYAGGASTGANNCGGGGGGAGSVGAGTSGSNAGNGGVGLAVAISGSSVTYAGGGGGSSFAGTQGTGGSGIGGAGGYDTGASAGSVNTGSGGGASNRTTSAGGAGGSGIVIVRYPV